MRPSEVLAQATRYLERHGVESPRSTAEALLAHVLGVDRATLYSRVEGLSTLEGKAFGRALCHRCNGTPVQHLTGAQGFRRLELEVRPGVFVPRPETEVVVDVALEAIAERWEPRVADIGTGTGAIALALADEAFGARVWATDRSADAVALARANADRLRLEVAVLEGDLLDPLPGNLRGSLDLVVSNPPYIEGDEMASLPPEVQADPELALLGGTDVHRRLVGEAPGWMKPDGALVMEIGADQGGDVAAMLHAAGFGAVRVTRDLAGRDRVVSGRLGD